MALAVSTIIAGVGVGIAGAGLYMSYENGQKAADANSAAAQNQAQIAALQAQNVDVEKSQLALQTKQNLLQINTNKSVIAQQQAADDIRQQAASLDATRRIREAVRTGIVASGTSLNTVANSGAGDPGSTAFKQSQANIQGQTNVNVAGIERNYELGTAMYNNNKSISSLYLQAQDQNSAYVQQAQTLQDQVLSTQKQIYALGGSASQNYAEAALAQGNAAIGSGIMSLGSGLAQNSTTIGKVTDYFTSSASNMFWQGTPSGTS